MRTVLVQRCWLTFLRVKVPPVRHHALGSAHEAAAAILEEDARRTQNR